MRKILIFFALLLCSNIYAQTIDRLWLIGKGVPGGKTEMTRSHDGTFRYGGTLLEGDILIATSPKKGSGTRYLHPGLPDAYIIGKGTEAVLSDKASGETWRVPYTDDGYKIVVDMSKMTIGGEVIRPLPELFIGGGCTANGWAELKLQPMIRDVRNPFVWRWTGRLSKNTQYEEPDRFKVTAQDHWRGMTIHPLTQDADPTVRQPFVWDGPDNKWKITRDGIYQITIDLLRDIFEAKIVK